LLRNHLHDPDVMIRAGMLLLIAGMFCQQFIHPPTDFLQGVVWGASGAMIGLSIVFNLRGLVLRRHRRADGE
jgi:hypothetical protein